MMQKKVLLSLAGGGIRGYIQALVLQQLEHDVGVPLNQIFSFYSGTSIGAIIAGVLSIDVPIGDIVNMFETRAQEIFDPQGLYNIGIIPLKQARYDNTNLRNIIEEYTQDKLLKQTKYPFVCIAVDITDSCCPQASTFYSHDDSINNIKLSDALMCSSAAPTYFDPQTVNNRCFVDGGLSQNMPSVVLYSLVQRDQQLSNDNIIFISIGTGVYDDPDKSNRQDRLLYWLKNGFACSMESQQSMTNLLMQVFLQQNQNYFQLDTVMDEDLKLDDYKSLPKLKKYAQQICQSNEYKLCINVLKQLL